MPAPTSTGLTSSEVAERIRRGQINRTARAVWLDYLAILARNFFTAFNVLVTPAAIGLFLLQNYKGAIAVSGMAIVNTALGLAQEIKAKWQLERLTLLVKTNARVRRDGKVSEVAATDIVLGDWILLASGDSVVADGTVMESNYLEVDEALLTGEADPVRKQTGAPVLSGSYCVAGEGVYRADRVGREAFAQSTAAQARHYRYAPSPLTGTINLLIHLLTFTAVGLCLIYVGLWYLGRITESDLVKNAAATITSMVPQGLVLTATISFTLGALHMSRRGAIVQRLHAVETMAAVDVICTDKTGTLTTNRLRLEEVKPCGDKDEQACRHLLALFAAASIDRRNKNIQALCMALGAPAVRLLQQIPFKSQNRFSAVHIEESGRECILVLGAAEALQPYLDRSWGASWESAWKQLVPTGMRVLLFAESLRIQALDDSLRGLALRPLALIALRDELRPEANKVLETLAAQGIAFKILSGDNAVTVRATIEHLHLPLAREPVASGEDFKTAEEAAALVATRSVFGRVSPAQKVLVVEALQRRGRHVAMIGDGVNDVLPIKRSDLGIAMGEGSQAARTVASLVLKTNDFALLPETLEEGRTIVRNLRRSAKIFLVKNVYSLVLILAYASGIFGVPFPYEPQQVTLLNWLVIGMPALVIAFSRERSSGASRPRFLREVGWFAVRTGLVFGLAGLTILALAVHVLEVDTATQKTLLLSTLVVLGITALLRALRDGEDQPLRGDFRFRWLGFAAVPLYLLAMYVPWSAAFFLLAPLAVEEWLLVLAVAGPAWGLTLLTDAWR